MEQHRWVTIVNYDAYWLTDTRWHRMTPTTMDFQSAMETFAEAWVAANTKGAPPATTETTTTQVFAFYIS